MPTILQILIGTTVLLGLTTQVTPTIYRKSFYLTPGETALLSCPVTNSSYTEWYKDDTRGAVIASYNNKTKHVTYDRNWENDVEVSVDERRYHLSITVVYRRDRAQIQCVARNGSQLQVLADYEMRIYLPPIITGLLLDSVRVLSDTLTLTAHETVQLELTVDRISHPFRVNWIVGDRDVTQEGKDEPALKLALLVTDDMQGRELRIIVHNGVGNDTMVKHIRINAAPFFVDAPHIVHIDQGRTNRINATFYSVPRYVRYSWSRDNEKLQTDVSTSYILRSDVIIPVNGVLTTTQGYQAVLVLKPTGEDVDGLYMLTVENDIGVAQMSVNVVTRKMEKTTAEPRAIYGEEEMEECEKCMAWRQKHKIVLGVLVAALSVTMVSLVAVCVAMRRRCPKENVKAISKPGMERAQQNHYSTGMSFHNYDNKPGAETSTDEPPYHYLP